MGFKLGSLKLKESKVTIAPPPPRPVVKLCDAIKQIRIIVQRFDDRNDPCYKAIMALKYLRRQDSSSVIYFIKNATRPSVRLLVACISLEVSE